MISLITHSYVHSWLPVAISSLLNYTAILGMVVFPHLEEPGKQVPIR